MEEVKNIIDDLGISALENKMNLAAVAVISDSGNLIYQTENWDLSNQTNVILDVIKKGCSFVLNNLAFSVVESTAEGIIGTNDSGMGHVIFVPFQGGILATYAMPRANPPKVLPFLKTFAMRLNGKI